MTTINRILSLLACGFLFLFPALLRGDDALEVAKARLDEMKRQADEYTLTLAGDSRELVLHREPLLRFSNPVGGVPDGIAVMWKDGERPAVFAQVFQIKSGQWVHECQSLAGTGLTMHLGEIVKWRPSSAAAEFRPLSESPPLAGSPAMRLLQVKSIAARFGAWDDFKISSADKETTRHELRLLPTPVYRYADPSADVHEAAVFAFVHGTDPELFLVLEYAGGAQPGWRYALAPMTCWAVEARLDDRIVWNVPERLGKSSETGPYHVWIHISQP